jgi:hypothetical protein
MPYSGAGAEQEGKKIGQEAGAKLDEVVCQTPQPPIQLQPWPRLADTTFL